jgi:hypothetical protein
MAIKDPRSGGANNSYYGLTGNAADLAKLNVALYEAKQRVDSAPINSKAYNDAVAEYNNLAQQQQDIEAAISKSKSQKETTAKSNERQKLVEAVTKAEALKNNDAAIQKAKDALNKYDGINPNAGAELRYGPNGESLIPGTTAYANGSTTKPTGTASSKTSGTSSTTTTSTGGNKGGTGAGVGGVAGDASFGTGDAKGVWISALKETFKTGIDDPKQKAQIDNILALAKAQKWTETTFISALKNTSWWQQTLPTLRDYFIQSHDPRNASTFAQTMMNKIDSVQSAMELLGIKVNDIDPVTGKVIDNREILKGVASQALQNGWDDNQIKQHLATKSEIIFTGGGQLGGYMDQIKRQALNYGVNLDKNQLTTINHDLLNPMDGKDAQWYLNNIKQQAIDANPWFAPSLKEGRSLYDVTSTYRQQMANLLEVDPTNITWNDLMNKVVNKDKNAVNTLSDFTKQVKQDPLWQYTKNAKETYGNMAVDLMKQFGFMG